MKKYIISIASILTAFSLQAQSQSQIEAQAQVPAQSVTPLDIEQFSAYGNGWIQLNAGATIYNIDTPVGSDDQVGSIFSIEDNYALIDLSLIGLDLSWSFAYANLDVDHFGRIDSYTIGAQAKPYLKLFDNDLFALRIFFNPFAAYTYTDFDTTLTRGSSDGSTYGVKTGIELSFFGNFYVAPAFVYTKVDSSGSVSNDFDMNTFSLELACKVTSLTSVHIIYNHNFEKEYYNAIKLSSDTVSVGLRLLF